ncbi:MAG: hypothetical protein M3460_25850 [Actinomycetota bacterium]|nr:hypothetical protein [Actinomycetota bacterium]
MARVLILAGASAVAVFTFVAARAASAANDAWQESVRAETRHTSSTVENIRTLYEDEAPMALLIRAVLIRAEELDRQADVAGQGSFVRTAAAAERATARAYLDEFRRNAPGSPINDLVTVGGDSAGMTGAQQIGRRLAALQEQSGQHAIASAALQKVGNQSAKRTQRSAIGMIVGALVALLGFILWSRTAGHTTTGTSCAMSSGGSRRSTRPISQPAASTRPGTTPGRCLTGLTVATTGAVLATLPHKTKRRGRDPFTHPIRIPVPVLLAVGAVAGVLICAPWTAVKPSPRKLPVPELDRTCDEPTANPSNGACSDSGEDGFADADVKAANRPENGTHNEAPAAVIGAPALPSTPPEGPLKQSRSALPAVIFAVLATVATALQITAGTEENYYLAKAARGAAAVGAVAVGSGPREAFATNGRQSVLLMEQRASDLNTAGSEEVPYNRALASALATADNAAAPRISAVVADMATPPTEAAGVDALARAAVSSSAFDREPLQRPSRRGRLCQGGRKPVDPAGYRAVPADSRREHHRNQQLTRLGTWRRHLAVVGWVLGVAAVLLTVYTLR